MTYEQIRAHILAMIIFLWLQDTLRGDTPEED